MAILYSVLRRKELKLLSYLFSNCLLTVVKFFPLMILQLLSLMQTYNEYKVPFNGDFVFVKDDESPEYTPPEKLTDENVVLPLYHNSIVDNILFLATNEEVYKSEFIRKSKDAFLKYWNDNAKGRRIRRMRW